QWLCGREIALPHGEATPVSPRRVRLHCKGRALPAPILYARLYDGLCLIATQGGPLYVSNTPLHQLLAMHPQMIQLNRWAVVNPSAIATIECQSQPIVVMADNIRIALSPKYLNNLPANLKTALHHEKDC
ncbi:MAG: LytTR family transcriptional regulator DNA-binding domain-containing protein, partial [Bacteroidales bacterium]|nr:LytTR family transcriptional regulator DNA-binding domain-containing protein [Bacteroidales bacterium]